MTHTPHERRALNAILAAISAADERDADDAAQMVWAHWFRYERNTAPHGRCPFCGEPLDFEPDSIEPYEYAGARGAHVLRGGYGCGECCVVIPEDQIVRVA